MNRPKPYRSRLNSTVKGRKLKAFLGSGKRQLCLFFSLLVHTTAEAPGSRAVKARKESKCIPSGQKANYYSF